MAEMRGRERKGEEGRGRERKGVMRGDNNHGEQPRK